MKCFCFHTSFVFVPDDYRMTNYKYKQLHCKHKSFNYKNSTFAFLSQSHMFSIRLPVWIEYIPYPRLGHDQAQSHKFHPHPKSHQNHYQHLFQHQPSPRTLLTHLVVSQHSLQVVPRKLQHQPIPTFSKKSKLDVI